VRRDDPPPGEEAQVDYGRLGKWVDPVTGEGMILNAFVMVLSLSRPMFVAVARRMEAATWVDCHLRAFAFFESVPRRIILDNLKSGVLKPDLYDPLMNRGYAELARHFGCLIDPARSATELPQPRRRTGARACHASLARFFVLWLESSSFTEAKLVSSAAKGDSRSAFEPTRPGPACARQSCSGYRTPSVPRRS
jgi:hypothetical protein